MNHLQRQLQQKLDHRRRISKLRRLVINPTDGIDFSSNDFLGLSHSTLFKQNLLNEMAKSSHVLGSTGSRLLDGNSAYCEWLERKIAQFHHSPAALIFNSGFDANTALFSTLPQPGDIVLYDEFIHASVHEGMRLSRAEQCVPFRHSNVDDLERLLKRYTSNTSVKNHKNIFVALETVYSMDGDIAPLEKIVDLLKRFWPNRENGFIIVDEAHSTGVFGEKGRGIICELGLEQEIFARLHTFGKALASHGAVVLGSNTLREYLINYARPLIYSTFMPFSTLISIRCAYDLLEQGQTLHLQQHVKELVERFRKKIELPVGTLLPSVTPIQGIVLNGNEAVRSLSKYLNENGCIVKPICSPTVPSGKERVRICLHGHNTTEDLDKLINHIHSYFRERSSISSLPKAVNKKMSKL
ncbi:putative aminotransferase [Mycotypha africana]|uniref:putative aminotransferase n=1 Tax=Mycotypha africana TaxID=64632 RepID=UPI002301513C|nr:putative aminotransferase [Mycotypha africana]KAI8981838.1 putative aminotransferase [Mycotypha africana]